MILEFFTSDVVQNTTVQRLQYAFIVVGSTTSHLGNKSAVK